MDNDVQDYRLRRRRYPDFLFVRSISLRRTTRINAGLEEFKEQTSSAVSIFLFLIGCVVVVAGKLAWTCVDVTLNARAPSAKFFCGGAAVSGHGHDRVSCSTLFEFGTRAAATFARATAIRDDRRVGSIGSDTIYLDK